MSSEQFFQTIRDAGFFKRLFSWKKITAESINAESEYNALKTETDLLRKQIEKIKAEETARQNETLSLREQLSETTASLRVQEEHVIQADRESARLRDERDQLKNDLTREASGHKTVSENFASLEQKFHAAELENNSLLQKYTTCDESLRQTKERLDELREETEAVKAEYTKVCGERDQLKNDLSVKTVEHKTIAENFAALDTKYNAALNETELLRQKNAAGEESLKQTRERLEEFKIQTDTLSQEYSALRDDYAAVSEKLKIETEQNKTHKSECQKACEERDAAKEKESRSAEGKRIAENNLQELNQKYDALNTEYTRIKEQLAAEESVKEERTASYERKVENLNVLVEQLESERKATAEKLEASFIEHQKELEISWQTHETNVASQMKSLCTKYNFNFCEKSDYTNRGAPDNVVVIGGLYTVFDAKCPKNPEELGNFPTYIKEQAAKMEKYAKYDNVRKTMFLVVPSSTLEVLSTFFYDLPKYSVYVITPEAILPILQILKLIEGYEFADQLNPEDREKLYRFIGQLTHATKRKIQIDTFLSGELINALHEVKTLPDDFVTAIEKFETKATLNPPMEKRMKTIEIRDIESDVRQLENEIIGWSAE